MQRYLTTGEMPLLLHTEQDFAVLMKATTHKPPFLPYSVRTTLARRGVADLALHSKILVQLAESPLLETQYKALATPALIVWGTEDQILRPAGASTLHTLFPNSRVNMMAGVGHLPMLEMPKRTAMDYLAYRRELSAA